MSKDERNIAAPLTNAFRKKRKRKPGETEDWGEVVPANLAASLERDRHELVAALKLAAPFLCECNCDSVKKTGEEWKHTEDCERVRALTDRFQ